MKTEQKWVTAVTVAFAIFIIAYAFNRFMMKDTKQPNQPRAPSQWEQVLMPEPNEPILVDLSPVTRNLVLDINEPNEGKVVGSWPFFREEPNNYYPRDLEVRIGINEPNNPDEQGRKELVRQACK